MNMEKEMLYNFITNSYIGPQFYNSSIIYNFNFNEQIGFNCCYKIQKNIKENILNNIYEFEINYCKFINKIKLDLESTILLNPELFYSSSKIKQINNNLIILKLIDRDWENKNTKEWFDYNLIRYSLYVVYYKYLKENNPCHLFVKFIEYISKLDFNNFIIENDFNDFKSYVINNINKLNKLKLINNQNINETLFYNIINFANKLRFNWDKTHFNLN